MKHTALHPQHVNAKAKLVDFSGWSMPMQYQSQLQEHRAVRNHAGIFDVSHMACVTITGKDTIAFLRYLVANDIQGIQPGKAMYTCMLNSEGGIIDDLIVYFFNDQDCRCIINAGCTDKDWAWMQQVANNFDVTLNRPNDLCIIAIQGPKAIELGRSCLPTAAAHALDTLKPFATTLVEGGFIARTGYTGEDGFEIILPTNMATHVWQQAMTAGITPCGLGARDTLRIEAGLNLYGQDMDENTSPYEAALSWTVSLHDTERSFIGKDALIQRVNQGVTHQLVGVAMTLPGVLRNQQIITLNNETTGIITSGTFSPILNHAIGFARVSLDSPTQGTVINRKKPCQVYLTKMAFVRKGQACQRIPA